MSGDSWLRVERNDPKLTMLAIGSLGSTERDLAKLGTSIGNNTHVKKLGLLGNVTVPQALIEGIQCNESINVLSLSRCNMHEESIMRLLKAVGEKKRQLHEIKLIQCSILRHGDILATSLGKFIGLTRIRLQRCTITDELLKKVVDAIKGHSQLELLDLSSNHVGIEGCKSLATLLDDSNASLKVISLDRNGIDDECTHILANALTHNTSLEELHLDQNLNITQSGWEAFHQVLCNTTSVNGTHQSNHTLQRLEDFDSGSVPSHIESLLELNGSTAYKGEVATKKILYYHNDIDMKSFFAMELKQLPHVSSWYERARTCTDDSETNIHVKMLHAIYQFAKALPLHFIPEVHKAVKSRTKRRNQANK